MAALLAVIILLQSSTYVTPTDTLFREEYEIGFFQRAARVQVSPQGWMYVVDEGRNVIELFKEKNPPLEIGGFGWGASAFDRPTGIATDGLNVFVADYGNHRIQRFDRNLNYISSLSTRDASDIASRFGYPTGVAISKSGELFVLDSENLRVVRFSADSRFLQTFAGHEAEKGRLEHPLKIVISEDDRIFVAEPKRILEYDYFGNYVQSLGEGILEGVHSCATARGGVVAATSDSLYWFSPSGELKATTPVRSLLTDERIGELRDVTAGRDRLYVLDPRKLFVFSVEEFSK